MSPASSGPSSPTWNRSRTGCSLPTAGQQIVGPLQFMLGWNLGLKIDDRLRERAVLASFGPVGVEALEDSETFDALADLADPQRGTGFAPGSACWGTLLLLALYVQ